MKERPILFSGSMVRAILDGRKTQTRRVVKPQPSSVDESGRWYRMPSGGESLNCYECPYGVPGDRLWVRETWAPYDQEAIDRRERENLFYRADDERKYETDGAWRPSIHMPRWASRITLEIVRVRVERVQEISEEDAIAEGIERPEGMKAEGVWDGAERALFNGINQPVDQFRRLWDSINAKRAPWESNPWVWVIEFRRVA